jgi:hypothetical protein
MQPQEPTVSDGNLESKKLLAVQPSTDVQNPKFPRWNPKARPWRIHQKIGYGYFLAIGIGFLGSLAGLIIADYYQGQGVEQLNDAHVQAQLLGNFKDAVIGTQLHGSHLASVLEDSERLQSEKADFHASVARAKSLELQIERFIESDPARLAADVTTLRTLLQAYGTSLESYAQAIESSLQPLDSLQLPPEKVESARKQLLMIVSGEEAMILERLNAKLTNILDIAQKQEAARGRSDGGGSRD